VRVVLETTIIDRLQVEHPKILDEVDLFAGTSAGGILALCFAFGLSNAQTSTFFTTDATKIFSTSIAHKIETLDGGTLPQFKNDDLKEVLVKQFGTTKLGELKKKVIVLSFQLDNAENTKIHHESRRWVPRFYHNLPGSSTNDELVVDVALRTSAAPTYFPIYQGHIDGAVIGNNPSMCAISCAVAAGIAFQDLVVLSLSTGRDGLYIDEKEVGKGNWGLVQWAVHLPDMLLDAGWEVTDFQCRSLLGNRYYRIDENLPGNIGIADPKKIPVLDNLAKTLDISVALDWLNKTWGPSTSPTVHHDPATDHVTTHPDITTAPAPHESHHQSGFTSFFKSVLHKIES